MSVYVSALELFSIGIGPSSSHTVGPMRGGRDFVVRLDARGVLSSIQRVECVLYGSLAATGLGHGTPDAVVAGLRGLEPETCDPADVRGAWSEHPDDAPLLLGGIHPVPFSTSDVTFEAYTRLQGHANALTLRAWDGASALPVAEETYYSIGGGFIRREGEADGRDACESAAPTIGYRTSAELLALAGEGQHSIAGIARIAERSLRTDEETSAGLDAVWDAMRRCVSAGLSTGGELPGGLRVRRRAPALRERLEAASVNTAFDTGRDTSSEWLQAFALAVNEENAAGGRVVTAPTNGAAGILPAVLQYYDRFIPGASRDGVHEFLLTAAAIGSLIKANASISGAEGGCQAEVGSACAMAAAGLCAVLGGTPEQVENAAEIAMEHHLGLTCDPIAGLVQIPCIERNAIAASTAVSAARLALAGDGDHVVSLDAVIETMRRTGADMSTKYKETSEGGLALAVNIVEC